MAAATHETALEPFSISSVPERDGVSVVPVGELDIASADALEREVKELRACGFAHVVIDLREIRFLDSTGLRVLLSVRNDFKRGGDTLTVIPGSPEVQRIFDLTATRTLFSWREH